MSELMEKSKAMAPMTKEEWEKRQSVIRRVQDEETGRYRLSYHSDIKTNVLRKVKMLLSILRQKGFTQKAFKYIQTYDIFFIS